MSLLSLVFPLGLIEDLSCAKQHLILSSGNFSKNSVPFF